MGRLLRRLDRPAPTAGALPGSAAPASVPVPSGDLSPTKLTPAAFTGGSSSRPASSLTLTLAPEQEVPAGTAAPVEAEQPEVPVPAAPSAPASAEVEVAVAELALKLEARPVVGTEQWYCAPRSIPGSGYPPLGIYYGVWGDLGVTPKRAGGRHHTGTFEQMFDRWSNNSSRTPAPVHFCGRTKSPFLLVA